MKRGKFFSLNESPSEKEGKFSQLLNAELRAVVAPQ